MPRRRKAINVSKREIGQRIRLIRQSRGLTQAKLAEALGTIQSNISDIERGARKPSLQQLVNVAHLLEVSVDQILLGDELPRGDGLVLDHRVLSRLQRIERLSPRDRQALLRNVDLFLKGAGVS